MLWGNQVKQLALLFAKIKIIFQEQIYANFSPGSKAALRALNSNTIGSQLVWDQPTRTRIIVYVGYREFSSNEDADSLDLLDKGLTS